MKKYSWLVMVLALLAGQSPLRAEWVRLPGMPPEADIVRLVVHPRDSRVLYAASQRNVYRSQDSGVEWKRVLSLRGGENSVRFVMADGIDSETLYVATDRGVERSGDSGKKWKTIYRGVGNRAKTVYWIAEDLSDAKNLWLGTGEGLVKVSKDGREVRRMDSLGKQSVYSVWTAGSGRDILLNSDKGVYKSADAGEHWDHVLNALESNVENEEGTPLSQFQIEELSAQTPFTNFAHLGAQNRIVTASSQGIFENKGNSVDWRRVLETLPQKRVNFLASSEKNFYFATDQGAFQWDPESNSLQDISQGLPSKEVDMLTYHARSGDLYAATKKGIFRFPKPEFKADMEISAKPKPGVREILDHFLHEPTILEIQQAAIRYGEVHPDKIREWREAASKKAWFPTVSLTADSDKNQSVDLDRGGTNDPDKFIIGPAEESTDLHAGISWDLGELIWNDDQTSIDSRSKLMVELRDDLLNEVTHLYFERRRLQVDMLMNPSKELPLLIEKELKLQELTAGIDALTGGFLSDRLGAGEAVLEG